MNRSFALLLILVSFTTAFNDDPMEHYDSTSIPTTWIGEEDLRNKLASVINDTEGLTVESYRLVSQKMQKHCHQDAPPYTHCKNIDANGNCVCWDMFKSPDADKPQICTVQNMPFRNCVQSDFQLGLCTVCKPGYYALEGKCRRGYGECSIDCPYCSNISTCGVTQEGAGSVVGCKWVLSTVSNQCFECANNFSLTESGTCQQVGTAREGCRKIQFSAINDISCMECKGNYNAVIDQSLDEGFRCELIEDINKDYVACVKHRPGSFVKEKWYQVIWSKDISNDTEQNDYWSQVETSTLFTIAESDLIEATGYDVEEINECRLKNPITQLYGSYDATCIRLLASRYNTDEVLPHTVPFKKIYYRGIVRMFRTGTGPCPDMPDKNCVHYDFDNDFLTGTLMWSQIGIWGPWIHIPFGCPVINATKPPAVEEAPCQWYNRVGKSIKAAVNFARFKGNATYKKETITVEEVELHEVESKFADVFKNAPGSTKNDTSDPMAKCLLNKLETISETRDVQCLFEAFRPTEGGWSQGLPSGVDPLNIKDCPHMSDMFEHGENCFQTIMMDINEKKIIPACNDFLTHYPTAQLYGECVNKCGNKFQTNYGKMGYNNHLYTNWSTEDDTSNGLSDSVYATRGGNLSTMGNGSYDFCKMTLWNDWDLCNVIDIKGGVPGTTGKNRQCRNQCKGVYARFSNSFEEFNLESPNIYTSDGSIDDSSFEVIQNSYQNILSQLHISRSEMLHLQALEYEQTINITQEEAKTGENTSSAEWMDKLRSELQKSKDLIKLKTEQIESLMLKWKNDLTEQQNDAEQCPSSATFNAYNNESNLIPQYSVSVYETFATNWESWAPEADLHCGWGSGDNSDAGRHYCGNASFSHCCNSTTAKTINGESHFKGMCMRENFHAACKPADDDIQIAHNVSGWSSNTHFNYDNRMLCDLRKQKSGHRALWETLKGVYNNWSEYKQCTEDFGNSPPVTTTNDNTAGDGSTGEGTTDDGTTDDGSAGDGSAGDGSAGDGTAGDGTQGVAPQGKKEGRNNRNKKKNNNQNQAAQ